MIFPIMLALALLLMLPLFLCLRVSLKPRGVREAALAIHRAQLDELQKDLQDARIEAGDYAGAKLEIERRLLRADALREAKSEGGAGKAVLAMITLIPLMAFLLYLPGGMPRVPSEPHAAWMLREQAAHREAQAVIAALRAKLATLDPNASEASEGQAYLAEALAEDAGSLTPQSIALFKQSLRNAPPGALWRQLDEQRLQQAALASNPGGS
jgi:cytochrome c-type biogenesis protein CcmH